MEKKKPHYNLSQIKVLIGQGRIAYSNATLAGASALSMTESDIAHIVSNLSNADFYVSKMASSQNKVWLDLYRPMTAKGQVFLKIKATDDVYIVSFLPRTAIYSAGP